MGAKGRQAERLRAFAHPTGVRARPPDFRVLDRHRLCAAMPAGRAVVQWARDLGVGARPRALQSTTIAARACFSRDLRYHTGRRNVISHGPGQNEGTYMNNVARTLAVRTRLRQRALPNGPLWRRLGEYAGGGVCGGCGERITSAQASYDVDFTPDVTPETVRFHRECFEIWEHECRNPASP